MSDLDRLEKLAREAIRDWHSKTPTMPLREYHGAANPSVVLDLIAKLREVTESRNEWASRMMELASITAERDAYKSRLDDAEVKCKELEIRIHRPFTISGRNHPTKDMCLECLADYPCQRLAAIDGDPTG